MLGKFVKEHPLNKSSIIRLLGALGISALSGMVVIYYNNDTYWNVTINRVQTVDFNILANILPSKLSKQLLNDDKKGLQSTLDSNYGLFGMVVTDCKSADTNCPQQKILYVSQAKVNTSADGKQKLELQRGKYPPSWADKLIQTENPAQQLTGDFLVLRDPPPLKQEWEFESPRVPTKILTGEQNTGNIIGRVYLLRGNQPDFHSEVRSWLQNPLNNSSKNFIYNAIAGSAIFTGFIVWLLAELTSYIKINADRQELEAEKKVSEATQIKLEATQMKLDAERKFRQANQAKIEAEERVRQSTEQLLLANQAAAEARDNANKAKEHADSIRELESKTQQEKNEAEQRATEAEDKLSKAEQRAIQAEEDKKYLFEQIDCLENADLGQDAGSECSINSDLNEESKSLQNENADLKLSLDKQSALQLNKNKRFSNAYDALIFAEEIFPILDIFDSAKESSISGNGGLNYNPDRVFRDLSILAHVGSGCFKEPLGNSINTILRENGVDSSGESYTIRNQDGARKFEGVDMYNHLKIGDLRIHFDLDRQSQRIQIGYCGKHL